ncbi:hypothetical protein [Pararobbsia silviterrae]|uniref:Uncharacterized protein n=1 Tax=Pararobbsia silviterrae TaxID=1792498 RepID=A0A494X1R4_9BURK|nr:hypothetical protein [Pararobbsia silviterrae]RKP44657.1 hypothetical protein D7S86_26875 [Pararobbsia silviterrae]
MTVDAAIQAESDRPVLVDCASGSPNLNCILGVTRERAARIEERNFYVVTGYVMTHHALAKKAVVDMGSVRWYPNFDEFSQMMLGRKITEGPGTPPPGWTADELGVSAPVPVIVPQKAPAPPSRPILTAAPSARLLESTEAALGELAREVGCVFNEMIPHNSGWFVPGQPTAYASAYDAIRARFARLEQGREPVSTARESRPDVPAATSTVEPAIDQGALF